MPIRCRPAITRSRGKDKDAKLATLLDKVGNFAFKHNFFEAVDDEVRTFVLDAHESRRGQELQRQNGAVRVNCLDCLDRTNFLQCKIGSI